LPTIGAPSKKTIRPLYRIDRVEKDLNRSNGVLECRSNVLRQYSNTPPLHYLKALFSN
jgi:hypothetical protein